MASEAECWNVDLITLAMFEDAGVAVHDEDLGLIFQSNQVAALFLSVSNALFLARSAAN